MQTEKLTDWSLDKDCPLYIISFQFDRDESNQENEERKAPILKGL